MKPHLYGTSPYIPDAPFLDADGLSRQSGGNTGNLMFCFAISRMLDASPISIPWGGDTSHLSAADDCLVLPLANQLGAHVDLGNLAEKFHPIQVPLIGVGLGAQGPISGIQVDSIPDGSWEWLRVIASKSLTDRPNISLRGQATFAAIAEKGLADKCIVTGCPSNFINPSATLGREIYRRRANGLRRIVVAAGNPFLPQFRGLEQSLVALVDKTEGMYICQHPIDMLRLQKQEYVNISKENFFKYKEYIRPDGDDDEFLDWFKSRGRSFTSVPEWLATMQAYDLVVGTRIHGVMAGIQAGVPSVCFCIDSRTLELCRTMMIPHVDANEFRKGVTLDVIAEVLRKWEWRPFDENRRVLAERFTEFFKDNGMEVTGVPSAILKNRSAVAASHPARSSSKEVHQISTASMEGKYTAIFGALARSANQVVPKILSFGCSDGFELNDLASKHFHHSEIVGCDVDDDALRIARGYNQFQSRVRVVESNREDLLALAPFDCITCMAVLCRWPITRDAGNIQELYPFDKFSQSIEFLVSLLRVGGILCVYNANYYVADTPSMANLEIVEVSGSLPAAQQVKLFNCDGTPAESQLLRGVLFRKI